MKFLFFIIISVLSIGTAYSQKVKLTREDLAAIIDSMRVEAEAYDRYLRSLPDSLEATLITCSPGEEAYTMFGHTAILIRNCHVDSEDKVYNYGVFDYNSDNFIYRFVKGETDYTLSAEPANDFLGRYVTRGYTVWEQELNLTQAQVKRLRDLLETNYLPENRVYRYNFLYDNCATRAYEMIEKAIGADSLVYAKKETPKLTFRDILHQFTESSPWLGFGIDMVLGAEVDKIATARQQLFIPSYLKKSVDNTNVLLASKETVPLVRKSDVISPMITLGPDPSFPLPPMYVGILLLLVTFMMTVIDLVYLIETVWYDVLLYLLQGLAGIVVSFLFFFSEHPAVGSNWLVLAFNPLVFLLIVDLIRKRIKGKYLFSIGNFSLLQCVNLAVLLFTILLFWLPLQWIHPALLPMVSSLLIRCLFHLALDIPSMRKYLCYD